MYHSKCHSTISKYVISTCSSCHLQSKICNFFVSIPFIHLAMCLTSYMTVYLFIYLSIYLFIYLFIYSICMNRLRGHQCSSEKNFETELLYTRVLIIYLFIFILSFFLSLLVNIHMQNVASFGVFMTPISSQTMLE